MYSLSCSWPPAAVLPAQAQVLQSLAHITYLPRVLVAGDGPPGWPAFLATTPKAVHFHLMEQGPATLLAGMRDSAVALLQTANAGWLHGGVSPSALMLAEGPDGHEQLLLVDFQGASRLGSSSVPTSGCYTAWACSRQEWPSLMTELEASFYSFLDVATADGLLWRHAAR